MAANRMIRWFAWKHLPPDLANVSQCCQVLADAMDESLDESAEKTAGLRKLLEAKDCFVRAKILDMERVKAESTDPGRAPERGNPDQG